MSDYIKLEYKVGAIEFKAEGPADVVEQQRVNFMNAIGYCSQEEEEEEETDG